MTTFSVLWCLPPATLTMRTAGKTRDREMILYRCCGFAIIRPAAARGLGAFAPILISFFFGLVSDQFLIGSGVASARTKLPRL